MTNIEPWKKITSTDDASVNLHRVAFVLDGVVQHVAVFTAELTSLLLANPTAVTIPNDSTIGPGDTI
jgi:hypothetical protein